MKITQIELLKYLDPCGKMINLKKIGPETRLAMEVASNLKVWSISGELNAVWFHVENEGSYSRNINPLYGTLLKSMGKMSGTPDYVFMSQDKSGFVELKSSSGKLSENQILFQKWCKLNNVPYEIVHSLEELKKVLLDWKMLK